MIALASSDRLRLLSEQTTNSTVRSDLKSSTKSPRCSICGTAWAEASHMQSVVVVSFSRTAKSSIMLASLSTQCLAPVISFAEMTTAHWQRVIDVNLTGVFHTIQAALPDLVEAGWGRVISISSHAGQSGALSMAHYSAAKGGVISLTKALARELAGGGTTVNTIAPSVCETPQMLRAIEANEFSLDHVTPLIPIPRAGRPDEIAGACAFLASDDAAYITGQVLAVNGGIYM
ncbi:SDR family oxidoreductase [Novosphingobium flavum]|uniref:SDR family oxidoreductase n=3 Tax=Novosphingobium aerophilum TaxID=2839843 RepID=A0A7X1FA47_9SPHN|nr:SDR family oxidoreductase [Novosphingobium aerophilum]